MMCGTVVSSHVFGGKILYLIRLTLVTALDNVGFSHRIFTNVKKTVCMVFNPKQRKMTDEFDFPQFTVNNNALSFI